MNWLLPALVLLGLVVLSPRSKPGIPARPVEAQPIIPEGYRRMADSEVTPELGKLAPSFLSLPFGAVAPVPNEAGLDVLAALEQHFHPVGGDLKPYGWHKGVSLYIRES